MQVRCWMVPVGNESLEKKFLKGLFNQQTQKKGGCNGQNQSKPDS